MRDYLWPTRVDMEAAVLVVALYIAVVVFADVDWRTPTAILAVSLVVYGVRKSRAAHLDRRQDPDPQQAPPGRPP